MERRSLGGSGLEVSCLGLGCNNFGRGLDLRRTRGVVDAALDAGINLLDTADGYGSGNSERYLGQILAGRRDQVIIATKFGGPIGPDWGIPRGSRAHLRRAFDESLKRLGVDTVDILYYHWPDPQTPVSETLDELQQLKAAGKVRALGCSNFDLPLLRAAHVAAKESGREGFTVLQNEYSLLNRDVEPEILPCCREHGVGFVAFLPLAAGLLTGKYRDGMPPGSRLERPWRPTPKEHWELSARAAAFAAESGRSVLQLALGGLLSRPGVSSLLTGATRPTQVRDNAAAANTRLSAEELTALARHMDAPTAVDGPM